MIVVMLCKVVLIISKHMLTCVSKGSQPPFCCGGDSLCGAVLHEV